MSRFLDPNEIFYDKNGRPLAGAFFGVGKDKYLEDDPMWEILRLILILVPPNEVQNKVHGDNASLPHYGQWQGLLVRKGDAIYLCSEDMKACFFLFRMPKEWALIFMMTEKVPGWTQGRPDLASVHFGLPTIPMGWINAVGILQYLHWRLVAKSHLLSKEP